jgi:hypothetical protein
MTRLAYEIYRWPLVPVGGQLLPDQDGIGSSLVETGTIDRATMDAVDMLTRRLERLSGGDAGPARYQVNWPQKRPRGPHAAHLRRLRRDVGVPPA